MCKRGVDLCRICMVLAVIAVQFLASSKCSWDHYKVPYLQLDEGDNCEIITGDPGICTVIEECDLYYNGLIDKTIPYSSLVRCSFKGFSEIICCPKTVEESQGEPKDLPPPSEYSNINVESIHSQAPSTLVHNFSSSDTTTNPSTERIIPGWKHLIVSTPNIERTVDPFQKKESLVPGWSADNKFYQLEETIPITERNKILDYSWQFLQINKTITTTERSVPQGKARNSIPRFDFGALSPPSSVYQDLPAHKVHERPSQAACRGYHTLNPAGLTYHIIGGKIVTAGDFPHMGALIYPDGGGADSNVRCGTSLISKRYTLTAAHCVNDPIAQPIKVRLGVVDLMPSTDSNEVPLDVHIENITLHPDYRSNSFYHDIALIRLQQDVWFTLPVQPACLYTNLEDIDPAIPLTVTGWGVVDIQSNVKSRYLLSANLSAVANQQCNASYIKYDVTRKLKKGIFEGQSCAYDTSKDACHADSGGPLQIVEDGRSTIVGVISFGVFCGSNTPSVYTRVAYYLSWIESIVWP